MGGKLQDSGERRHFDTGAVRDVVEGKGRCDLLPAAALLRLAKHYEKGAEKYAERNWEKGIPISVMLDSGIRHILKYLDGQTDEDHLCAATWNLLGAMWMEEKKPELQNIPSRQPSKSLNCQMVSCHGCDQDCDKKEAVVSSGTDVCSDCVMKHACVKKHNYIEWDTCEVRKQLMLDKEKYKGVQRLDD